MDLQLLYGLLIFLILPVVWLAGMVWVTYRNEKNSKKGNRISKTKKT